VGQSHTMVMFDVKDDKGKSHIGLVKRGARRRFAFLADQEFTTARGRNHSSSKSIQIRKHRRASDKIVLANGTTLKIARGGSRSSIQILRLG